MMTLRINPLVALDLKNIKLFIAEDSEERAADVIEKLLEQFEFIRQFPLLGTDLSRRVSFRTDYKYTIWKEYIILYKITKEFVEIYRVINHYQDITRIFPK